MVVTRLTEQYKEQYSLFVAAHGSGSFLQSWSWGKFQTKQGKEAVRYAVLDNNSDGNSRNNFVATIQLLYTKIPRLPGSYLYAPYGPLINPEFDTETIANISQKIITQIKTDFSKSWFIRIEPKDDLPIDGKPSLHIQPGSTLITDLTIPDTNLLLAMHQKTRYNIKVAAKHGVKISSSRTSVPEAIKLLAETSERQGYKSHPTAYYEKMLNYFNQEHEDCSMQLYQAVHEGQCIAAAIMVDHGTTRTYLFGGSDNSQRNLMAPYALHWQAMRDAKQAGLTKYDWWGTETASGATPGFVQFKLRWGGIQKFYAGSRDIVLNSAWYQAYNALRKVNRFF